MIKRNEEIAVGNWDKNLKIFSERKTYNWEQKNWLVVEQKCKFLTQNGENLEVEMEITVLPFYKRNTLICSKMLGLAKNHHHHKIIV